MKIKAAVFDMDGLMFDTERLAMAAWDYAGKFEHERAVQARHAQSPRRISISKRASCSAKAQRIA